MNYKIIYVALLFMNVNVVLPVIDTKEETEQKQSPGEKQCACYCKKILEMINDTNSLKLSTQEKDQMIQTICGQQEEKDIKPERMKQWMMHAALLE